MYRRRASGLEVFLVHPGGPFWARKDAGAWSIPKGEIEQGEAPIDAARREFAEETGSAVVGEFAPLGWVRMRSGKVVHAWAVEGEIDADAIRSNVFTLEWPPRSGRQRQYPEADRAAWFPIDEARQRILAAQAPSSMSSNGWSRRPSRAPLETGPVRQPCRRRSCGRSCQLLAQPWYMTEAAGTWKPWKMRDLLEHPRLGQGDGGGTQGVRGGTREVHRHLAARTRRRRAEGLQRRDLRTPQWQRAAPARAAPDRKDACGRWRHVRGLPDLRVRTQRQAGARGHRRDRDDGVQRQRHRRRDHRQAWAGGVAIGGARRHLSVRAHRRAGRLPTLRRDRA